MADLTNVMRAATENMLSIVQNYKKDLSNFNSNMESKISEVEKNLAEIRRNWNDSNFDAFNKIVKEKLNKLKGQITNSRSLESVISDTEKDFKEALSELN